MTSPSAPAHAEHERMRPMATLFLVFGVISMIAGLLALSATVVATLASVVFFGVVLLVAGFTEVVHAFVVREFRSFSLHLLAAALYLFTGFFMLEHPVRAAGVLTLIMAASFLVGGALRIFSAAVMRFPAWGWVLLNGAVDLLLGFAILSEWPGSALWVIGLFLGVDLLLHGWAWVILSLNLRKVSVVA